MSISTSFATTLGACRGRSRTGCVANALHETGAEQPLRSCRLSDDLHLGLEVHTVHTLDGALHVLDQFLEITRRCRAFVDKEIGVLGRYRGSADAEALQ